MEEIEPAMDLLQDQIAMLTLKVDSMYQTLEQLSQQTTEVVAELKLQGTAKTEPPQFSAHAGWYSQQRSRLDEQMEHKDVLVDVPYPEAEPQGGERLLSPEVQVQRLTAQLTAAYNRIAALEEQLLSKRMASQS
jgi:DNA transposition AAA+ family ATPase